MNALILLLNSLQNIYKKFFWNIFMPFEVIMKFFIAKKYILAIYLSVWKQGRYYRYAVFEIIRIEIYWSMIKLNFQNNLNKLFHLFLSSCIKERPSRSGLANQGFESRLRLRGWKVFKGFIIKIYQIYYDLAREPPSAARKQVWVDQPWSR